MDPKFESFQTHLGPRNPRNSAPLELLMVTITHCICKAERPLFTITDSLCHALHGSKNDGGSTKELFHNLTLQSHKIWLSSIVDRNMTVLALVGNT